MITPPIVRLFRHLDTTDPSRCWTWQGALAPNGYAHISRGGAGSGVIYIHRLTYETYVGPIADGLHIDHLCRNRACCNPAHLEAVTPRENVMRGESHIAANPTKTHCPQGHAYDSDNTYHYDGSRQCRKCRDVHRAKWRARHKGGESVALPSQPVRA